MKFGVPWSVKGIRPEARESAREAARRSGMSLGDWLNSVILDNAAEHGIEAHADEEVDEDEAASVHERLDDLTRKIDRMSRPSSSGPAAYAPKRARGGDNNEQLTALIARLDQRLEDLVTGRPPIPSGPAAWSPPLAPAPPPMPPAPPPLPGPHIDRAVAEIAARQRALEANLAPATRRAAPPPPPPPPAPQPPPAAVAPVPVPPPMPPAAPAAPARTPLPAQDLSGLEEQLRTITSQIETLRRPGVEEAINALRDELGEIARSLTEALPRHAMDGIEREIQSLSHRVAEGRQAGVDAEKLGSIEHGLAEVRDTLRSLTPAENLIGFHEAVDGIAHKLDLIVAQKDPQSLQQLEAAITTLREISSHVASNEAVGELSMQVHELAAKVDYMAHASAGGDALSHLEQRIAALSDALEARAQNGESVPPRLEALVNSLADKIERVQQAQISGTDNAALAHLEDRIVRLVEKLDASDSRLGHLEAIERGLADLLVHVQSAPATAEMSPQPGVEALKRDLARTQDSLEAVNGTLGLVVDRLAMIEQGLRNPPPAAQTPPPAPMPAAPMSLQQPVQAVAAQVVAQVAAAAAVAAPRLPEASNLPPPPVVAAPPPPAPQPAKQALPARKQQPIDPNLPPDHPLEPGTGPRGRGSDPAARIAASEAALSGGKPPVIDDPGGKSDFIAAARRAAQTAAKEPPKVVPAPRIAEMEHHPVIEPDDSTAGSKFAKRIKSFFVASSIVAIVVGSVQLGLSWLAVPKAPGAAAHNEKPIAETKPKQTAAAVRVIAPDIAATPDGTERAPAASAPLSVAVPNVVLSPTPQVPIPPVMQPQAAPDVTGSIPQGASSARPAAPFYPISLPAIPGLEKLPSGIGGPNLRNEAAAGDAAAAYEVGVRYAEGHGVAASLENAARWFERAANKGLAPAQFRLGSLYEKGKGVKKDLGQARKLYVAAADTGNAKAMHNLAVLYAEGIDGKPDYATAAQWFHKAAERGVSDSQYNLAILYARGLGVEKSFTESYKWFALAAAQGDKEAAKKRDEVGGKLDAQALAGVQSTVTAWRAEIQPPAAVSVPVPPDGWDNAPPAAVAPAPAPVHHKLPGPLKLGSR